MAWWIWLGVGLALAAIELLAGGEFYFLLLGAAAAAVGLIVATGAADPLWLQVGLYAALACVAVFWARARLAQRLRRAIPDKEVDSIAGERATALTAIPAGGSGKAELRGTTWSARTTEEHAIAAGQPCRVERVEGLTLWVRAD